MPTKNDDVSQSALYSPSNEDEQTTQLKELSERVARLESFIPRQLLSDHFLKALQSRLEEEALLPSMDIDAYLTLYIQTIFAAIEKAVEEALAPTPDAQQNELPEREQGLHRRIFRVHRADEVEEAAQREPSPTPDAQRSELPERKQRLLHQLDEWLADDSGYDEETWPKLKDALEQDRLSSRSLFDE